jgi:hypothetical protein
MVFRQWFGLRNLIYRMRSIGRNCVWNLSPEDGGSILPNGVITQKTNIDICTAVGNSNLGHRNLSEVTCGTDRAEARYVCVSRLCLEAWNGRPLRSGNCSSTFVTVSVGAAYDSSITNSSKFIQMKDVKISGVHVICISNLGRKISLFLNISRSQKQKEWRSVH